MTPILRAVSPFYKKLNSLWFKLVGDPSLFPLEFRIFHSIAIITIINALLVYMPVTFSIGLYIIGWPVLAAGLIVMYLYYRSRYKGKMHSSVIAFGIIANLFVVFDYFYDSGISGPADILMSVTLLLIAAITVYGQQGKWLIINIGLFVTLHIIEYQYPQLVHHNNKSHLGYFLGQASAYLVAVVLFYFTIKYVRGNYEMEKKHALDKTRALEEQQQHVLLQNRLLEHLDSEKNKLMSIISHDLRAPLGNIQNYLEMVKDGDLDHKERGLIEAELLNATQSTLNMLSTLLTWSKSQMGGIVVNLKNLNLLEALKDTIEMERIIALKKDITLNCYFDPEIEVVADKDMLQLVLRNLVSNAIKFTPPGGKIDVSTEMEGVECKVTVKDNGNGIAYAEQPEIFSLKAKSTFGTNNEKGVGLGLLLCKEFIELQGGRISFESVPGQGSSFFILMAAKHGDIQTMAGVAELV